MAGAHEMDSMDEFLNHKSTDRGGSFLGNWKKDGKIVVWMHRKQMPVAVWQHKLPKIVVREEGDDDESVTHVWTGEYVCHEDEAVLKKQYKRDRESGEREVPPRRCPVCKLVEHVRALVDEGKIDETAELFRFEADDDDETRVVHAAGMYGGFPKNLKEATDEQKEAFKKAHIRLSDVWAENGMAKLSYVFAVVSDEDVGEGVQIAKETGLLGDKVKDVIADAMESLGREAGNPQLNPFAIQWVYLENEKEFGKKYKARRMENIKLTPEIDKAISGPKPDLSGVTAAFEIDTLKALLQRAYVGPKQAIPWDELFVKPVKGAADEEPDEDEVSDKDATPDDDEDDGMVKCDVCEKPMPDDVEECPTCHSRYDLDTGALVKKGAVPPPAPAQQPKKRGARKKAKDGGGEGADEGPF
jgi:hypothetical protein